MTEPTITLPLTRTQAIELLLAVQARSRDTGSWTAAYEVCVAVAELLKARLPDVAKRTKPERNGKT